MLDFRLQTAGKSEEQNRRQCSFRWEITNKCTVGCKHCGRLTPLAQDYSYAECLEILANFRKFLCQNNFVGQIIFTGGDPLLRKDFLNILEITTKYQQSGIIKQIDIDGNPFLITPEIARRLKSFGISHYGLSLDGLEKTHDYIRKPGSFQQTILALRHLKNAGIRTKVHFTLSRLNADEIDKTLHLLANEGINVFTFALLIPKGRGINLKSKLLTPLEYRNVLVKFIALFEKSPMLFLNFRTSLAAREYLFARVYYELGRMDEYKKIVTNPGNLLVPQQYTIAIRRNQRITSQYFQRRYKAWEEATLLRSRLTADKFVKCRKCPTKSYCRLRMREGYHQDNVLNPLCWVE